MTGIAPINDPRDYGDYGMWGYPTPLSTGVTFSPNFNVDQYVIPQFQIVPMLKFKKLHENAKPLALDTVNGGYPLYALHDTYASKHGAQVLTGLSIEVPWGWYATISTSSGFSKIFLVTPENCKNLSVYIHVDDSGKFYQIEAGQEVGRLFLHKDPQIMAVEELSDLKGGSTGR